MEKEPINNTVSLEHESERVSKLMNSSGELVILRGQYALLTKKIEEAVKENRDPKKIEEHVRMLERLNNTLSTVASNIQSGIMQMRMISVKGTFDIIRDQISSDKSFKKGENSVFELGEETEIDRNVHDQIKTPLVSLSQTLWALGTQYALKKTAQEDTPRVFYLKAFQKGNSVFIEIMDSYCVICSRDILDRFEDQGVSVDNSAQGLEAQEKENITVSPGDVDALIEKILAIKQKVDSYQGHVSISVDKKQSLNVRISVPLSLSIYKTLLVKIGASVYAIPISAVTEIINILNEEMYTVDGNVTIKLRDHALSLIDLHEVIGLSITETQISERRKVVVITDGEKKVGIFVDHLIGEEDIVIKPLADHYSNVKGINGASILGDGCVALVLDPISILSTAQQGLLVKD